MRKLFFESASAEDFLKRVRPLWSQDSFIPQLMGDNDLARDLLAAATEDNVVLQQNGILAEEGKTPLVILTEQAGEALHSQLMSCLKLSEAIIVAPITDWHFSKRPVFLISIPKAGTHLLYELANMLGFQPGIEMPEFPRGQNWYCIEYENSHTKASDFFVDTVRRAPFGNRHHSFTKSPAIFIYRHPLDVLVSEAHYYHLDGKTAFAGWFSKLDFSTRIERLLADNELLGSFRSRISSFIPWLDFPNVIKISFEELVGGAGGGSDVDQVDLIWSLLLKLQVPGDPEEIGKKLFNSNAATFRSGQIGGYHNEISPATIESFLQQNKDILDRLGYGTDRTEVLPARRQIFREQPLSFSKINFDLQPINVESWFLDCNIVRYAGRIYALPISAGELHLDTMSPDILKKLPSASTVEGVKALLLVGQEGISQRLDALHKLGAALCGQASMDSIYPFWQEADAPNMVEEYNGFNIVFFRKRFYGIRRSIGEIDLTENLGQALASHSTEDFFVASSIADIRDEIDKISMSFRVKQYATALVAHYDEQHKKTEFEMKEAFAQLGAETALVSKRLEILKRESGDAIDEYRAAYQLLLNQTQNKMAEDFERKLRLLNEEMDSRVTEKFGIMTKTLADIMCRQEQLGAELRETLEGASASMQTSLQRALVSQQSEIDRQAQTIVAVLQSWPFRLARRVKGFAGRKK